VAHERERPTGGWKCRRVHGCTGADPPPAFEAAPFFRLFFGRCKKWANPQFAQTENFASFLKEIFRQFRKLTIPPFFKGVLFCQFHKLDNFPTFTKSIITCVDRSAIPFKSVIKNGVRSWGAGHLIGQNVIFS
jgi:hypothetical protein